MRKQENKKGHDIAIMAFLNNYYNQSITYSAAMAIISTNSSGRANADSPQARAGG